MLQDLKLIFKQGFWLLMITWLFIIHVIKAHFGEMYSPDSYAFYLLGKNIIANHSYYSPAIRDFYLDPAGPLLSRSYPPLFPLLVGITDFLLTKSMAAGRVINLVICMFALYVWLNISKQMFHYVFLIPFLIPVMYSLLPFSPLWVDAAAGRSSPLTWLLLLAILDLLIKPSIFSDNKISIGVGIFLGLLMLARFDTLIFCFFLPLIIYCSTQVPIKKIIVMYITLLLVMLPWAIRNFIVFGNVLASDNTFTVAATVPGIVQLQFFEHGVPLGIDDPGLWIQQRLIYLKNNALFFYSSLSNLNKIVAVGVPINILVKTVSFLYIPGFVFSYIYRKQNYSLWIYFITTLTWCVLNIICISLTSYGYEPRYYGVSWFTIVGGGSFFITTIIKKIFDSKFKNITLLKINEFTTSTIRLELYLCLILVFLTIAIYSKDISYNKDDYVTGTLTPLIKNMPVQKGELVASTSAELTSFYTGWNTIYLPLYYPGMGMPLNAREFDTNYQAWLKRWKPSYLMVSLIDFDNPLARYPHATVAIVLDKFVLLKLNLDETVLTKEDQAQDTNMRHLWLQNLK